MKNLRRWMCTGLVICAVGILPGCSFRDTLSVLTGKENHTEAGEVKELSPDEIATRDGSVAAPEFTKNLEGTVNYVIHQEAQPLTVEVQAGESAELTYQWYRNSVESNGGGTPIEGATDLSYTPSTEEAGKMFYYLVATNTEGNKFNMTTSGLVAVQVSDPDNMAGEWEDTEDGQKKWKYEDGTYATSTWKQIDEKWYAFDENGNLRKGFFEDENGRYYLNDSGERLSGWFQAEGNSYYADGDGKIQTGWIEVDGVRYCLDGEGKMLKGWQQDGDYWCYLGEDGTIQKDTTVDGQTIDADGHWVPVEGSDSPQAAIDAAAAAAAAAQAEQPAEGQ